MCAILTGLSIVLPGQISKNTFDFLNKLKDPKCNDREWSVCVPLPTLRFHPLVPKFTGLNYMVPSFSCPFFANGDIDLNRFSEPVYRLAEQEWKDFVSKFSDILVEEVDDQVPPLPPKDCIMRIYRDVRFSNDKTPYKKNFSASFSRGGRKGIFAHCE